jgi:hypothetical protein
MTKNATKTAIGSAGFLPELTSVIATCGVGVDGPPPGDCTAVEVGAAVGVVTNSGVASDGDCALTLRLGVAVADRMTGGCVGRAVGRTVGFGVAVGDGGAVAAVVTTMLPCIAAYPWMLQ